MGLCLPIGTLRAPGADIRHAIQNIFGLEPENEYLRLVFLDDNIFLDNLAQIIGVSRFTPHLRTPTPHKLNHEHRDTT